MKLGTTVINTNTIDSKFGQAAQQLKGEPYIVIECKQTKGADPDAFMLSPTLYKMLLANHERYLELTKHPDYGALRQENARVKQLYRAVLNELKQARGADATLSTGAWKTIRDNVNEAIEDDDGIFRQ